MELFSVFGRVVLNDNGVEDKLKNINQKAQEADSKLSQLGENISKFGEGLTKVGESLVTHLTLPLAAAGAGMVKLAEKASDLNEAQNVIENTFKKSSKAIEEWTNTTANSAGISKTASSQWVGFMGAMLKSSGVTEQKAGDMSKTLVQLTGDMSSFYNIGTSDMWEKIRAGISGETMPLKQLGINMDVANLEAYALSEGIKKPYKEMSQSEQTILRYNYLLSVTKDAQGDFARTLNDSFANQGRVAKLNLETIATTLGSKFLPSVMQSTKGLNDYLVALNKALNGENQSSRLGTTINNIANAVNNLTPEKIKNLAGIGGALAALGPGIIIFGKLTEATGKFEAGIGKGIEGISELGKVGVVSFKGLGSAANETFTKLSSMSAFEKLSPKVKELGNNFEWMTEKIRYGSNITPVIDGINSKISGGMSKVSGIIPQGVKNIFGTISKTIGAEAPKVTAAFKGIGDKVFSGLQLLVSSGLKIIGPAALIGVLLVGLGLAQTQFGSQLNGFFDMIIKKGPSMIQSFTDGILSKMPMLMAAGTALLTNLIQAIITNLPALLKAAVQIINALVNGIDQNLPILIPEVIQLIQTILTAIVDNLPAIIMAGVKIIVSLVQGISNNITQIVDVIVKVVTEIIKILAQNAPLLIQAGIQILVAIIQGLSKAIPQLVAALPQIVQAIWNGLKAVNWGELGGNIIDGIIAGLKAAGGGILNTLKAIAGDALSGVKALLGIHSPSRVFRDEVGKNISLGIAEGINDVDFMQSLTDAFNNTDDPAQAAEKVADLVSEKIKNIKDESSKNIKDLNNDLSNLSNEESIALRGVKGSSRYAIQDEYNEKKQAIKDEIQLRKDQADKEITEIQRIGKMSKEALQQELDDRKSFVESVNNLSNQIVDALKKKYTEEEKAQEDSLNEELDNLDKWKDASEKAIDDVANARITALQAESDVLDEQQKMQDRAESNQNDLNNINKLKSSLTYEHNDYNKAELQKQIDQATADYNKKLQQQAIEDKKESLKKQMDTIKADAEKQKQDIENIYNTQKAYLQKGLSDLKNFYDKKLSDENLNAEAEKMIMQNNQDEIVTLLNSYGDQYKTAGQTLGDRLAEGFRPAIDNIKNMISSITAEISSARDSALSVMQMADTAAGENNIPSSNTQNAVTNNSKTSVTNNFNFTHNSPAKTSPAEQRQQDEVLFRKAIFTVG